MIMPVLVDRPGHVESGLEPIGHAVRGFPRSIGRAIRYQAAWKVRVFASLDGIVQMMLRRPFADFDNLAGVDLNLVVGARRRGRCCEQAGQYRPQGPLHDATLSNPFFPSQCGVDAADFAQTILKRKLPLATADAHYFGPPDVRTTRLSVSPAGIELE